MKDKLRDLAKDLAEKEKDYAPFERSFSEELLAILDAEGDGGAVPVGYADPLSMQGYTLGQYGDFCVGDKSSVRSVPLYDRPHSARSGVVSDEDVEAAWAVLRQRDVWPEEWNTNDMRAAIEHFAKGERHER